MRAKQRDPRVSPVPGDQLERGTLTRTVVSVDMFGVVFTHELGTAAVGWTAWRLWSRGSRIVSSVQSTIPESSEAQGRNP